MQKRGFGQGFALEGKAQGGVAGLCWFWAGLWYTQDGAWIGHRAHGTWGMGRAFAHSTGAMSKGFGRQSTAGGGQVVLRQSTGDTNRALLCTVHGV